MHSRATQTRARGGAAHTQTACEAACQTRAGDVSLAQLPPGARVLAVRPYTRTSAVVAAERGAASTVVQRWWRGHLGRQAARARATERAAAAAAVETQRADQEERQARAAAQWAQAHPRASLEAAVARRLEALAARREAAEADPTLPPTARRGVLLQLVAQQAEVIHQGDSAARALAAAAAAKVRAAELDAAAAPKALVLRSSAGSGGAAAASGSILVTTPATAAAQDRAALYREHEATRCPAAAASTEPAAAARAVGQRARAATHPTASSVTARLAFLEGRLLPFLQQRALQLQQRRRKLVDLSRDTVNAAGDGSLTDTVMVRVEVGQLATLAQREATVLRRGRPESSVVGLQERVGSMLAELLQQLQSVEGGW